MSKRIFTKEQVTALSQNKNVLKCSERSIAYHKDFKLLALRRHRDGLPSTEVFREGGFNLAVIGNKTPKECLKRWRKTYREKGANALLVSKTGRPRKDADTSEKSKIEKLETEIAYLKAENDFLIKLRAKRAEQYSSRSKSIE